MFNFCSGMPECKLGLNDRLLLEAQGQTSKGKAIDLDDIKFHQYVILISAFTFCFTYSLYSSLYLTAAMILSLVTT